MLGLDGLFCREVRNGACDDSAICTGGDVKLLMAWRRGGAAASRRQWGLQRAMGHFGVGAAFVVFEETVVMDSPGGNDAFADDGGGCGAFGAAEFFVLHGGSFDVDVEARSGPEILVR
jgi:hypothetical protein